jgi:hypothetical protein
MLARISHVALRVPAFSRARARAYVRRVRATCIKGAKREMVILTSRKTDGTGERRGRDELSRPTSERMTERHGAAGPIYHSRRANYYRIVHSSLLAPALLNGNLRASRLRVNETCRRLLRGTRRRSFRGLRPRVDSRDYAEVRRFPSRFVFLCLAAHGTFDSRFVDVVQSYMA